MFKEKFKFLIFVLVFFVILFYIPRFSKAAKWMTQVVDSQETSGFLSSLALDSNNLPYISYTYCQLIGGTFDFTTCKIKYAFYDGNSWTTHDVGSGIFSSLTLDSSSHPHLCYVDNDGTLYYGYYSNSSWQIHSFGLAAEGCSIALDSSSRPHIIYEGGDHFIKYVYYDGASWASLLGDSVGQGDISSQSLKLDSSDSPHVVFKNSSSGYPTYAYYAGGWKTEVVESIIIDQLASLVLDSSSQPHLAYHDRSNNKLKYAARVGSSWTVQEVDSVTYAVDIGMQSSLDLNSSSQPAIAYLDTAFGDLKYAYYDGSSWQKETVDSDKYTGEFAWLVFDKYDQPHISYWSHNVGGYYGGSLKYTYYDFVAPEVTLSNPSGIYSQVQNVELKTEKGATIYYITDGSQPTTSSTQYTGAIRVNKPMTLKYFAKDQADNQSEVAMADYIITPTPFLYQANTLVNYNKGRVKIYSRKGKYRHKSFYPFGKKYQGRTFFAIGDADHNQKGDIVAGSSSEIKILTKAGKTKLKIKTPVYRLKVADLNLDGKEEILAVWKNKLKVYSGKKKISTLKTKRWIKDFTVARLENPEKPLLVVSTWDNKVRIYQWKNNKKFKLKKKRNFSLVSLSAIDTNNDGIDELAVRKKNRTYILNSSFKPLALIKKSGVLTIADVNKDDKLEIVVSQPKITYFYGRRENSFLQLGKYKLKGVNLAGRL